MKLLLALAAGLLGYCYKCGIDARNKKGALKEDVTRWEGEGGNVPTVATPSPAPAAQAGFPRGDGGLRH
jgi:hypothetical protein